MAHLLGGVRRLQRRRVLLRPFPLLVPLLLRREGKGCAGLCRAAPILGLSREELSVGGSDQEHPAQIPRRPVSSSLGCGAAEPLLSPQCVFLVWCMAPVPWNGSQLIYHNVIRPFFLKHHSAVDNMMGDIGTKALDAASSVTREGDSGPPSLHPAPCPGFPSAEAWAARFS